MHRKVSESWSHCTQTTDCTSIDAAVSGFLWSMVLEVQTHSQMQWIPYGPKDAEVSHGT